MTSYTYDYTIHNHSFFSSILMLYTYEGELTFDILHAHMIIIQYTTIPFFYPFYHIDALYIHFFTYIWRWFDIFSHTYDYNTIHNHSFLLSYWRSTHTFLYLHMKVIWHLTFFTHIRLYNTQPFLSFIILMLYTYISLPTYEGDLTFCHTHMIIIQYTTIPFFYHIDALHIHFFTYIWRWFDILSHTYDYNTIHNHSFLLSYWRSTHTFLYLHMKVIWHFVTHIWL